MYSFIYYYFYTISIKRNPIPKDSAAYAAAMAITLHIFLIFLLIKKIFEIQIPQTGNIPVILLAVLIFTLSGLYMNRLKNINRLM